MIAVHARPVVRHGPRFGSLQGIDTVFCSDLDDRGFDWVAEKIRARAGKGPVYLSVDIDVADPAFAPGTGTPEVSECVGGDEDGVRQDRLQMVPNIGSGKRPVLRCLGHHTIGAQ